MRRVSAMVIALFAIAALCLAHADNAATLPIQTSSSWPALLLDLGGESMATAGKADAIQVIQGAASTQEAGISLRADNSEVTVLHPGFGSWKVDFRFPLTAAPPATAYRFWARWRQGGEPDVCVQTFEIWAGPDADHLQQRATYQLKPKGWESAWISSQSLVSLKADDKLIEIRDSGAGHDAKVFDAFLLAPPLATLPVNGTVENPAVLLELGKSPVFAGMAAQPGLRVLAGGAQAGPGAESLLTETDEVQVFHQGFGAWQADFRFQLDPSIKPGRYRFFARYKSGGEVSQVTQRFVVKAGASPEQMANRAELTTLNNTPWEYQWLQAEDMLTLLPGDRWLEINNSGQADGAKVFDGFVLKMDAGIGNWMSAEQARARNRFLALTQPVSNPKRYLYVLDGKGENDKLLFAGLASAQAKTQYAQLPVSYLIGEQAETLANRLNISQFPAAVISDDHHTLLGVLSRPKSETEVVQFLAEPEKAGGMPTPTVAVADKATTMQHGMPAAWLVGGVQDGLAGMSVAGLDSESVLRPNPGQAYLSLQMMGGEMKTWQPAQPQLDGSVDILKSTPHAYGWSRGTGYAQLYLHTGQATQAWLHLTQSGIKTAVWLDGKTLEVVDDPRPPAGWGTAGERIKTLLKGLKTEGLTATAVAEQHETPRMAKLELAPGWHSLLLKLAMQHDEGQRFFFKALFTDSQGQAINGLQTQLDDPTVNPALNRIASQIRPLIRVDAPANLPHPGDRIKLKLDMRWHPILEQTRLPAPLPRFKAKLLLRLLDYNGKQIGQREVHDLFPGQVEIDFDRIELPGYYAVYPSLHAEDGQLIMNYPADGFSVVAGAAEQKQRLADKKLWNNDYYALADGDKSFSQTGDYFSWLQRMGIFNSYGSYPGFDAQYRAKWEQAKQSGLQVFADSAGDSHWLNDKPEDGRRFIDAAAGYSRYFKSSNEIDIRHEPEWQKLREPAHWLERAKSEYQRIHQARKDGHYVGGSLVRPAEGDWFKQVLQLGLDRYQDAWDVHAYPQKSPRFGQPLGNGETEDERGVLAVYAGLGKKNTLPFWLGETGAKAMHGFSGRRWQAEQVAKMIAWVNSRRDYLGLAFCIAHEYDQAYGRIWDYSMGHKPGEAALYTAGALIDGLPYQAVDTRDAAIQAAKFGSTFMVWRDDAAVSEWPLRLDPGKTWVMVDVVGNNQALTVDATSGNANIPISASPVYVLPKTDYERLTRN
ncbi:hypothetical protein IVG45_01665 [Methylomonas sp. LL1]|uniref:hypothetical protein n=1 Tax=Methylomonas sp. LL1 TaxID=2785785 RepID=UPI0018C3CBC6|nr:hypothetical protein [Methylomonas sp. LL1]QPK63712.1 hypothetical protein IVG45_01665 [Methylomonas sp. LL1]